MVNRNLKKRIMRILSEASWLFLCICIVNECILQREDWLSYSVLSEICCVAGYFGANCMYKPTSTKELVKLVLYKALISINGIIILMFITGYIMKIENWESLSVDIWAPFSIAFLLFTKKKAMNSDLEE